MKKTYIYLLFLFASFSNAQTLIEDFEGTTFPPTGWTAFETGTGVAQVWSETTLPAFVCQGNKSALINRENVTTGSAIDWLVSPLITVPSNGDLSFVTKTIQTGVQGSTFSVKVSTTSQTDTNSFAAIATWDEASLTTTSNNCQEKMVDLSAYSGQNVYIAFVMENDNGDRWIVDNIRMHQNLFKVVAFIDLNNNGVKDINENNFNAGNFQVSINNGAVTNYNTYNGVMYLNPSNGTDLYDISLNIYPEYSANLASSTNYNDISPASLGANATLYFPIVLTSPFNDVEIQILNYYYNGNNVPPGGYYPIVIQYKNNGCTPESGVIQFNKSSNLSITNVYYANVIQNPNGFTFNYTDLQPQETRFMVVSMQIPNIPIVQLGDIITTSANITAQNTDLLPNNNTSTVNKTISSSYDPNDKYENHGPTIVKDNFTNDDYLVYTIRFQNTGNASTSTVRVEDFLDAKLNPATVRMINTSHECILSIQNNHLIWKFDPIFLTPLSVDEDNSHGYITFKVKPFPGYQVGDIIPNTASIYFDTNPAIITNTFQTEFVSVLANESFNSDAISIYPNPSNDFVNIQVGPNENIMESIEITDVLGKKVFQSKFENKINISNLTQGVYFITLLTNENEKFTKKIIKE